jgi:hypothetical protein
MTILVGLPAIVAQNDSSGHLVLLKKLRKSLIRTLLAIKFADERLNVADRLDLNMVRPYGMSFVYSDCGVELCRDEPGRLRDDRVVRP